MVVLKVEEGRHHELLRSSGDASRTAEKLSSQEALCLLAALVPQSDLNYKSYQFLNYKLSNCRFSVSRGKNTV